MQHTLNPELRFLEIQQQFVAYSNTEILDQPLSVWVLPSDRHLPSVLLQASCRSIVNMSYRELSEMRGIGTTKIEKLLSLLERALARLGSASNNELLAVLELDLLECDPEPAKEALHDLEDRKATHSPSPSALYDLDSLDESTWSSACSLIVAQGLAWQPIGRFAPSLTELPRGTWSEPLGKFINLSLASAQELDGYGDLRLNSVIRVILNLANAFCGINDRCQLRFQAYAPSISSMANWIHQVLVQEDVPDLMSLSRNFVKPLLNQIEIDLGVDVAEMVERRLGVCIPPQTLQEISEQYGLTRERIRQITTRAPEVMQIRWPEGRHLLDDFFEKFHAVAGADEQVSLIQRTLDLLFKIDVPAQSSSGEILAAWETAGRRKETPMSESQILCWLGGNFPHIEPSKGFGLITQAALSCEYDGRILYFSDDEHDHMLHRLYTVKTATSARNLTAEEKPEERNIRGRLYRDLRFCEDEDHCWQPTELLGFVRDSDGWHVELDAVEGTMFPMRTAIPVDTIVTLAIAGLIDRGIHDVTVWGFHRFVNEQLATLFNARLRSQTTPFVLADMVVRTSSGRIKNMRRRRLRWDSGQSNRAKGKRGWIGFVVNEVGTPIVIDELNSLLMKYYQDYAPYVLQQLNFETEEEGDSAFGVAIVKGIGQRLPQILVPDHWALNANGDNVSDGVKLALVHAIKSIEEGALDKNDLEHIPWFIALVNKNTYGNNIWCSDNQVLTKRQNELPTCSFPSVSDENEGMPVASNSEPNIDELLSKFI